MESRSGDETRKEIRSKIRGFISGVLLEAEKKRLVYVKIHGLKGLIYG